MRDTDASPSTVTGSPPAEPNAFVLAGEAGGRMQTEIRALRAFSAGRSDVVVDCRALRRIEFVAIGELLRLHDGLEALGGWFQRRLAREDRPSRVAEGFVTASLVFCVGPLTILGSLENGLTGDIRLLAVKSLLG